MEIKMFEIRDRGTYIPVIAIRPTPTCEDECYMLARAGYGREPQDMAGYILVARISGGEGRITCDPYEWGGGARTMQVAHDHIQKHYDELETGAVVDVEFIMGETAAPKVSERITEVLL